MTAQNRTDSYLVPLSAVVLITLIVYFPVLNAKLVNIDDFEIISNLTGDMHIKALIREFVDVHIDRYYRPISQISFIFDYNIWQWQSSGYHLTNYMVHLSNGILLWFILRRLQTIFHYKNQLLAAGCALLFSVHPLTCESVAWVSGRTDVIATFFCLAAFYSYLAFNKSRFISVPVCMLLGLWTKESALSLAPLLILSDLFITHHKCQDWRKAVYSAMKWGIILLIPLCLYFYLRMGGGSQLDHGVTLAFSNKTENIIKTQTARHDILNYLINIGAAIGFYIKKLFVPFPLNFAISEIAYIPYIIFLIALTSICAVLVFRKKLEYSVWLLLLTISFSPALMVATSKMAWMPFAERYLYMSCAVWATAIFFLTNYITDHFPSTQRHVSCLLLIILCVWSIGTFKRTFIWHDNQSLWHATIQDSPNSAKVMFKYAAVLIDKGDDEGGNKLLNRALENAHSSRFKSYILLGLASQAKKENQTQKAEELIKQALETDHNIHTYKAMASHLLQIKTTDPDEHQKNIKRAVEYLRKVYNINHDPVCLFNIAKIFIKEDTEAAQMTCKQIISHHPTSEYAAYAQTILDKLKSTEQTEPPSHNKKI